MSESADLDRIAIAVRAAAKECDTLVIESIIATETNAFPTIAVEGSVFPTLIRHIRPKLLYLVAMPFDVTEEVLAAFDMEDEGLTELPLIKKLASAWRYRENQTCRVAIGVMCDGVLHGAVEEADWLAEFVKEAESLTEELDRIREGNLRELEAGEKNRLIP